MKLKLLSILFLASFSGATAFAGSVLVYRNSGWWISDWKYRLGNAVPLIADGWQQPDFDDRAWQTGKGSFGYGAAIRYGTKLKETMPGATSTIYLRTTFLVSDRTKITHPILDVNCSGGFVAWINGVRVAERDVPAQLAPDATATASRNAGGGDYESFPLKNPSAVLRDGVNVLAIQALSADRAASAFLIDAGLVDTRSLAHNRPAFASTSGAGQNRNKQFTLPFNAVDGSDLTFSDTEPVMPQWFYVDLGEPRRIDKVRYHWWGDRQPRDFKVQISTDAEAWTDVHAATGAPRAVRTDVVFKPATARYVRLHVTRTAVDNSGISFGSCEVFEPGVDFEPSEFASLATGRPVTASSETKPGSFHGAAAMAVNGHGLSWWTSKPEDPQWLAVDLGARQPINRVRVYANENEKAFKIQISDDGAAWTDMPAHETVTRIAAGDVKGIYDLRFASEVPARHVRFFGTERQNPQHGYSIVELAVFRDREVFAPQKPRSQVSARPYENGVFKGRIAWSADGNHNDPDDWIASPLTLAIFAEAGLKDRLVHFDYNCILPQTNVEWEKIHAESVLGAAERWGYERSLFVDVRQDRERAIANIARAIDASSEDNPLYFVVAGPMEVPYYGIQKSDPAKRKFVYCISHSRWNEGFAGQYKFTFNKRSVIEQGVHWVQVRDQNRLLAFGRFGTPSPPEEFAPYFWMRDSNDPKIKFLWERMVVSTRPDPSDAGMAWFLATGDEEATPDKVRQLIAEHRAPTRVLQRKELRIEAENFVHFEGYALEDRKDPRASHQLNVKLADGKVGGQIRTKLEELYAPPEGRFNVEVRFMDEKDARARFAFFVNGQPQGESWRSAGAGGGWTSHVIRDVPLRMGDELRVDSEGAPARIDFVQFAVAAGSAGVSPASSDLRAGGPRSQDNSLDDPAAMPGGLIVAGSNPGYLKWNGGAPVYLSGADDPETFFYLGTLNPDGTRSDGKQEEIIQRMAGAGVTAFHAQIFRMQRCNIKKEGDDTHVPFVGHDPSKPLNEAVLAQWEKWITALERAGIVLHFEFYNDATDVELMGWKLDASGNLHADEHRFVAGIVRRFKHLKNILWGLEESVNKLPRERTAHFKKMAQVIAETDNFRHPIVQSFVVPNDPEGDDFRGMAMSEDYAGDPHIRVVTWLHLNPHGDDLEMQHRECLRYAKMDGGRFVVMKNETFYRPYVQRHPLSRQYIWAAAMAGMHMLEAQHKADRANHVHLLKDDGMLSGFMQKTDFFRMKSDDALAHGATKWVLANPGQSYIAYSYGATAEMGVKNLPAGKYDLLWFDCEKGRDVVQPGVDVKGGNTTWPKPAAFGAEVALYIKRATP